MRRRWRAPNVPTGPARQVWSALFPGHPWPTGWRVEWVGFMRGARGLCLWSERRILLSYGDAKKRGGLPVHTLVHEFVHVRSPKLRHGEEFRRIEAGLLERLGLATRAVA